MMIDFLSIDNQFIVAALEDNDKSTEWSFVVSYKYATGLSKHFFTVSI